MTPERIARQTSLPAARAGSRAESTALTGVFLFAAGLALRLYRLGAQSLWLDEGGTWAEVTGRTGKGWWQLFTELWSPTAAYPLYHLLMHGWTSVAGDSEWALRFPSALAGALAVVVVWLAGRELLRHATAGTRPIATLHPFPLAAALVVLISPFALWQSQDAKVYSLLLLTAAALLWLLLRALRTGARGDWLALLGVGALSVFVHRLALLGLAGAALAVVFAWPGRRWPARAALAGGALLLAAVAIYGTIQAVGTESRGGTGHIPAGPLLGLWLTLTHFALDRGNIDGFFGVPLLAWALPALLLTAWGLVLLARDARRGGAGAIAVLCLLGAPLLLFAAALAFAPLYESRYTTVAFPAWALALAYPLLRPPRTAALRSTVTALVLVALHVAVSAVVLLQPKHGLFSGDPVKEQWRAGVTAIARQVHPDDLLILHPYYVRPLWEYYAPRVTPDPLPKVETFDLLGQGFCRDVAQDNQAALVECYRRNYETAFNRLAYGKKRMLMLLAPEHARTIDPPKTLAELRAEAEREGRPPPSRPDTYGFLGLRFQYASDQRTWPCGGTGDALIGVEVMCASFPSFYHQTGPQSIPQPETRLNATFGGELELRGYTISPLGGELRPGGTLPITLYWQAKTTPSRNYTMFLHLCRDCSAPPLAQDDRPPLNGYAPAGETTTWRIGDPVHDERAIYLPPDLKPGRYTLLLGVYPAGEPQIDKRLPVESDVPTIGGTRLVLGQVEIAR